MCFRTVASCAAGAVLEASGDFFDLNGTTSSNEATSLQLMNCRVFGRL